MKRIASLFIAAAFICGLAQSAAVNAAESLAPLERLEIQVSFARVLSEFYKKVDTQAVLDGARSQMLLYLHKNGATGASLPALHALSDNVQNERAVENEVRLAVERYGSRVGSRQLTYAAIAGMLNSVKDRYTQFFTPKEFAALNESLDGKPFSGVGIVMGIDETTKYIQVSNVVAQGPADRAGIQEDDLITAIDGKTTHGMVMDEARKLLRGDSGTTVHLTIMRKGALLAPIPVVRAQIRPLSVISRMLPDHIGYVELLVFGRDTASELTQALDKLQSEGARGYVLDLRDNGGGYLESAVEVSSKFITTGPIVSVESRASTITTYDAENTAITPKPLVVLVNSHTASASEITSGAIQDSGVGTIIGTKTYGKGLVQTIFPLPDGSAIKITTARYFTPRNRDINAVGIQPDIQADENKDPRFGVLARDSQLVTAIGFLKSKIAQYSY